jgi:hypothetical protein
MKARLHRVLTSTVVLSVLGAVLAAPKKWG